MKNLLNANILKGRGFPNGTVRKWKNGWHVKDNGEWKPVSKALAKKYNLKPEYINPQTFSKNEKRKAKNGKKRQTKKTKSKRRVSSRKGTKKSKKSKKSKFVTARESETQKAKKSYIPKNLTGLIKTLYGHQKEAVNLALEKYSQNYKSFLLADGTGTGKTMQQLAIGASMLKKGNAALIITQNKQIINDSFKKDAKLLGIKVKAVSKPPKKPAKDTVYLCTYHALKHFASPNATKFDFVSFDESHNLKNKKSNKAYYGVNLIQNAKYTLMATATPMDKGEHIHYLCRAFQLNYYNVMRSIGYTLEERYVPGLDRKIKVWQTHEDVEKRAELIDKFFSSLTRKGLMIKREVSLDNLKVVAKSLKLTKKQQKEYNKIYDDYKLALAIETKNVGIVKAQYLLRTRRFLENCKLNKIKSIANTELKQKRQVVIFAENVNETGQYFGDQYQQRRMPKNKFEQKMNKSSINELEKYYKSKGKKVAVLTGNTTKKQAKKMMNGFQKGDIEVFITTSLSGGTGINLDDTTGDKPRSVIIATPPLSANTLLQNIGRVNRLNTKSVAKAIMLFTEGNKVEDWNKHITTTKLASLNASVQGNYKNLDINDLEKFEYMTDNDVTEYLSENKLDNDTPLPVKPPAPEHDTEPLNIDIPKKDQAKKAKEWVDINIPIRHKDEVKKHGARWDSNRKTWKIRAGNREAVSKYEKKVSYEETIPATVLWKNKEKAEEIADKYGGWYEPSERKWRIPKKHKAKFDSVISNLVPLNVPYRNKDEAKSLGAVWDGNRRKWMCEKGEEDKFSHLVKSINGLMNLLKSKIINKTNPVLSLLKARKYPIGHISHRANGDFKKINNTGDQNKDWKKLKKKKATKKKKTNKRATNKKKTNSEFARAINNIKNNKGTSDDYKILRKEAAKRTNEIKPNTEVVLVKHESLNDRQTKLMLFADWLIYKDTKYAKGKRNDIVRKEPLEVVHYTTFDNVGSNATKEQLKKELMQMHVAIENDIIFNYSLQNWMPLANLSGDYKDMQEEDKRLRRLMSQYNKKTNYGKKSNSIIAKVIRGLLNKSLQIDILKGRGFPDGTIREWGGQKVIKQNGEWFPYNPSKNKQKESPKTDNGKNENSNIKMLKKKYGIPKNATNIRTYPKSKKLLATWEDSKGRKQYRYTKKHNEEAKKEKFESMYNFAKKLPEIRLKTLEDIKQSGMPPSKVCAAITRLIDITHIRRGSKRHTEQYGSYGASTLLKKHVTISGNTIKLRFKGKSNVMFEGEFNDPVLAKVFRQLKRIKGPELFQVKYKAGPKPISGRSVTRYMKQNWGVKPKDFRTFSASRIFSETAAELGGKTKKERTKNARIAIKKAASALNHTPKVCKNNYIDPTCLEAFLRGDDMKKLVYMEKSLSDRETKFVQYLEKLKDKYYGGLK